MSTRALTAEENPRVEELVALYQLPENQERLAFFLNSLTALLSESKNLAKVIHSFKARPKSEASLRDKLRRQLLRDVDERKVAFHINRDNFFVEINDLVACRILHLHTRQMQEIDRIVRDLLSEAQLPLLAGYPTAKVWDDESRKYFEQIGIQTEPQDRMYSSVHYVVNSNSRFRLTGEIQVRTLAQELWGEVDHKINYPHPTPYVSCKEQIRTLSWVANGCTRLVDSIFASYADERDRTKRNPGTDNRRSPRENVNSD